MNARTCMACGSDVEPDATRCSECGAEREPKLFHEGSDVRLEHERLGEELPSTELSLPAGRWSRASEHPKLDPMERVQDRALANDAAPPRAAESDTENTAEPDSLEIPLAAPVPKIASPVPSAAKRSDEVESHPIPSIDEVSLATLASPPTDPRQSASAQSVVRPPVLASEALQRDLTPSEPAPMLLRFWSPLLGLLGVAATWLSTHGQGIGAPLCGAFAALAVLGVPRMPYTARAGAVATVSATGLTVVLWTEMGGTSGAHALVLTLTVTLLATGLFFRSWHRASSLSRFMVALGILLGGSFLWMSEAFTQLTMLDTAWQSWAPRVVALPFGILLMLSLLAFMNARTTAGASAWATFILLWYALHATLAVLQGVWPKEADQPDFSRVEPQTMLAWGSAPIFSALLAISLAQLIASSVARSPNSRPRPDPYLEPIH